MGLWYHVAEPNSYLVITGAGIDKVLIKKKVCFVRRPTMIRISISSGLRISLYFPAGSSRTPCSATEGLQRVLRGLLEPI